MPLEQELDRIQDLMARMDVLAATSEPNLGRDEHWLPESREGRSVFEHLIAEENREALRRWYFRFRGEELNPTAAGFKACLERALGERLG